MTNIKDVSSISIGQRYVWVAGSEGITTYDKLENVWDAPVTRTPFPKDIQIIAVDRFAPDIWFVTSGLINQTPTLCRFTPCFRDYKKFTLPSGFSSPESLGISKDYVYLVFGEDKKRFDKKTEKWSTDFSIPKDIEWFPEDDIKNYSFLSPYYVEDIGVGKPLLHRYYMSCCASDGRDLWVGTKGQGVYRYDKTTLESSHFLFGIFTGGITTIWKEEDIIWFGGIGSEIARWNIKIDKWDYFYPRKDYGLLSTTVSSAASSDKYVWLGTPDGLSQFDKKERIWRTFRVFDKLPADNITALAFDGQVLWIGTEYGLARMVNGDITRILLNVYITDICPSMSGPLIATPGGVFRQQGEGWRKIEDPDKLLSLGVEKILIDGDTMFFGSRRGLIVYSHGDWKRFKYPTDLPGEKVLSIAQDEKNLWVGTENGVGVFDKKLDMWQRYDENNSPLNGSVYTILIDEPYVYFGTLSGLVRFRYGG